MDIQKGRKWLSKNQINEVENLEMKQRRSQLPDAKTKFSAKDKATLEAYYRMIDYLGSVNG